MRLGGVLLALAAATAPAPVAPGRYVLRGTARVDAPPLPRREQAVDVLALLGPGARADDVRLQLRAFGYACDLRARRGERGALSLPAGQTCRVPLDDRELRGAVTARLRAGTGTLRARELALELSFELSGAVATRLALGGAEAWTPEVPVRGTAEGAARGEREDSR